LLAHGQWFSPGTPASSTTKIGRHNIAECGVKDQQSNQIKKSFKSFSFKHRMYLVKACINAKTNSPKYYIKK
jgi:hypothetical protein